MLLLVMGALRYTQRKEPTNNRLYVHCRRWRCYHLCKFRFIHRTHPLSIPPDHRAAERRLRAHERVARVDASLAVGAGRIGPLAQQLLRVRRYHRVGEVRAFYRLGVGDGAREV